jgi:tetratricopeptide (TPR) repeat protein
MSQPVTDEHDEAVERLLRDAHILRMRQRWGESEELCRKALELAPEDVTALEMLGDLLTERGSADDAEASYRRAFAINPSSGSLETKIARAVLEKAEAEHARTMAQLALNSPMKAADRKRGQVIPVLLSVIAAGGGQLYKGEFVKGGILLGVWLVSLFGAGDAFKLIIGMSGGLPRGESANGGFALLGMVGGLAYLYSLMDAPARKRTPGSLQAD